MELPFASAPTASQLSATPTSPFGPDWQTLRERQRRLLTEEDCDLVGSASLENTVGDTASRNATALTIQMSEMGDQTVHDNITEARQATGASTIQRNVVLEFLLQFVLYLYNAPVSDRLELVRKPTDCLLILSKKNTAYKLHRGNCR